MVRRDPGWLEVVYGLPQEPAAICREVENQLMAFPLPISSSHISVSPQGCSKFSCMTISRDSTRLGFPKSSIFAKEQSKPQLLCSRIDSRDDYEISDVYRRPAENEGSKRIDGSQHSKSLTSKKLMEGLRKYGISGILSYGLLNTIYYLTTFLLVWFYVAPAPGRMGYAAAVQRFFKVMALVWAGSQVTKLIRAGGALALAPIVDNGLSWFTVKFKFESKGKAFMAIVGLCFGCALMLFLMLTVLWA
ncbi:hypothetical protein NE237_004763 [Protea cynaroides]|uniref:Gag-Pol polyprotein/retrotransposon n=1 Tax=Protea cynaroides TaxID=273540 RepID=A0A9Q0KK22_9MAGN|nr:hypothetical protein NE237_004763 [Protea cynaroides]